MSSGKKLTEQEEYFIITNWDTMSNRKIAKILGIHKDTVCKAGRRLGLKNKKSNNLSRGNSSLNQIECYRPGPKTIVEMEGRKRTLELENIKDALRTRKNIKIKVKTDGPNVPDKLLQGEIIQKNDSHIVVKFENYIECFGYVDFYIGKAVVI